MSEIDVLVVDDDPDLRAVIELLVETLGFAVSSAGNGQEGYEKAISLRPRLILSDLMMPRIRGDRLRAILHDNPETAGIPCILMTSAPAVLPDFDGHLLTKPFDLDDLEILLHWYLGDPPAGTTV
jgi:CheY-like chemotaxis protein